MKRKLTPKNRLPLILATLAIFALGPIVFFTLKNTNKSQAAEWWNGDYKYRTRYSYTATAAVTSERKVKIDVDTATLITATKMQSDCDDVRFTDSTGKLLDYFIDTNTADCNNASTDFYVKVPSVAVGGNLVYMYYGNASVARSDLGGRKNDFFDETGTATALKAYWKFNESSANTCSNVATDDSCDSALANDALWTGNVTSTTGKINNGVIIDSSGDELDIGSTLSIADNTAWTVSLWVKPTGVTNYQVFYALSSSQTRFFFGSTTTFLYNDSNTNVTWSHVFTADTWHHVVLTSDGTSSNNIQLYVNNVAQGVKTLTDSSQSIRYLGSAGSTVSPLNSTLDDFRIYNRALSTTEITNLYNSGNGQEIAGATVTFTPSSGPTTASEETTPGPVVYWKFDEGQGQTINDNTTHNNDGTLGADSSVASDDPTWKQGSDCVSGKCLQFDGSADYVNVAPDVTGIKSIGFWVKPITTTEYFVDLDGGTTYISATSGTVSATGFTSPTIYVNGLVSSTLTANKWQYIEVTSATAVSGTAITLGKISTNYLEGFMDDPKIYPYARSAAEVKADYSAGAAVLGQSDAKDYLSDGLVGYWKMDEAAANTCTGGANDACDSSGNSNDGAWTNNATRIAGRYGNGVDFDGTGDIVSIADNTLHEPASLTISAWVNWDAIADNWIISKQTTTYSNYNNGFVMRANNPELSMQCSFGDGSTNAAAVSADNTISTTGWYLVTCTYDQTNGLVKLYINGSLADESNTTIASIDYTNVGALTFGGHSTTTTVTINGQMDDFRMYNRALSPDDVRNLYNFAPGPVGYWNFDEGTGQSAADISGYSNTGTVGSTSGSDSSDPTWTTGKYGKALLFDGTDDIVTLSNSTYSQFPASNDYTIQAWVYITSQVGCSGGGVPCNPVYTQSDSNNDGIIMYVYTSNDVAVRENSNARTGATTTTTGSWHHIAVVRSNNGANLTSYDNGIPTALSAVNSGISTSAAPIIGGSSGFSQYFHGIIDEVKVYNYGRTSGQITEDMNGNHPLGGSPLGSQTVQYKFDEQQGSTANNTISTNSSITGTISGATWKTKENCKINGCLDFDGTDDVVTATNTNAIDLNAGLVNGLTFSSWIYADSDGEGDTGQIFQKGTTTYCRTDTESAGRVDLECSLDLATTDATLNISSAIATGSWNHIAVSWTDDADDEISIYINGVLRGTSTDGSGAPAADTSNLLIGGTTTANFDGKIDQFSIYNSELSVDNIRIDMNSNSSVSYSVLGSSEQAITTDGAGTDAIGFWKFDEKTGSSANDISGNSNTGTITNATWLSTAQCKEGACLNFDGSGDYVTRADDDDFDFGTGSFTLQAWFKHTTASVSQVILAKYLSSSGTDGGYKIVMESDGDITCGIDDDQTSYPEDSATTTAATYDDGRWHHVTCLKTTTSSLVVFIDGVPITTDSTISSTNTLSNTDAIYFGIDGDGSSNSWNGQLDGVKIYNYARTRNQITQDYNRGKPVAWWKFDECQGSTVYDSSGNGKNGTITIGASGTQTSVGDCATSSTMWGNGASGKFNSSFNSDGTDDVIDLGANALSPLISGATATTANAWFKIDSLCPTSSSSRCRILTVSIGTSTDGVMLGLRPTTGALTTIHRSRFVDSRTEIITSIVPSLSVWHMFTAVADYTGKTLKIYLDGKLVSSNTANNFGVSTYTPSVPSSTDTIGGVSTVGFYGKIDDVRLHNYGMSQAEINKLYNEGSAVRYGPNN